MSVEGKHKGAMKRQTNEGVRIRESAASILMNSRQEWRQPDINRVVIFRGNAQEVQR